MTRILPEPSWSEGQREFIRNLEEAGATEAQHAVPIDRTMALPPRELKVLVDSGVVREASANGYYVYTKYKPSTAAIVAEVMDDWAGVPRSPAQFDRKRIMKGIVFWLVVMAIPIIMIQCLGRNR